MEREAGQVRVGKVYLSCKLSGESPVCLASGSGTVHVKGCHLQGWTGRESGQGSDSVPFGFVAMEGTFLLDLHCLQELASSIVVGISLAGQGFKILEHHHV